MDVNILQHDVQTGMATIRFTNDGEIVENVYDLLLVLPDMKATLARTKKPFDAALQDSVIVELTSWMQRAVDRGTFKPQSRQDTP